MDLHSGQCVGYFDIPVDHVYGETVILDYLASKRIATGELVVVSPDVGGVARARAFAKKLNDAPLAIIDKRRSAHNVSEVMHLIGDVKGKVAVLVDDMIDTAGTITNAGKALLQEGAKEVRRAQGYRGRRVGRGVGAGALNAAGGGACLSKPCTPPGSGVWATSRQCDYACLQQEADDTCLLSCCCCCCCANAQVYACTSHAVFSPPAIERLSSGVFSEVIVTNTIPVAPENVFPQLTILSVANLLGETIWRVYNASSVQALRD